MSKMPASATTSSAETAGAAGEKVLRVNYQHATIMRTGSWTHLLPSEQV